GLAKARAPAGGDAPPPGIGCLRGIVGRAATIPWGRTGSPRNAGRASPQSGGSGRSRRDPLVDAGSQRGGRPALLSSRRRLVADLQRLEAADPSLAGLTARLEPLLELLDAVDAGATLDVWVEFMGGHAVVADVASKFRGLVRDAAGPGLGFEGD